MPDGFFRNLTDSLLRLRNQRDGGGSSLEDAIRNHTVGGGGGGNAGERRVLGGETFGINEDYRVLAENQYSSERLRGMSPNAVEGWQRMHEAAPRYYTDDVSKPAGRGADAIIELQRALAIAGYLAPGDEFSFGKWDAVTAEAYTDLLTEANVHGLTAEAMLERAAASEPMGDEPRFTVGPDGQLIASNAEPFVAPPLEARVTSEEDLRNVFRSATQDRLGIALAPDEINSMIKAYQWDQLRRQNDAHTQRVERLRQEWEMGAGGGMPEDNPIVEVDMPSPEAYMDERLRTEHRGEYEENTGMGLLMSMINQWGATGGG